MKRIYTLSITLMMVFLMSASSLIGQRVVTFTVNSPEELKGTYPVILGSTIDGGDIDVTADLEYGVYNDTLDGCSALTNDLTDKIAAIDRGSCAFVTKAENAKNAGAKVVIIFNNTETEPPSNIAGTSAEGISIFGGALPTANKIKEAINAGKTVNVTLKSECKTPEYDSNVFWGNLPGQGDFSNGFEGWEINPLTDGDTTKLWEITPDGSPTNIWRFPTNSQIIESPTACNGAAIFEFSKFAFGDNPNPQQPYTLYSAELISPSIDCSGKSNISLSFYQSYNRLNQFSKISYSVDGGETWSEPTDVSYEGVVNQTIDNRRVTVPVAAFENQKDCRVKFIAYGDFYTWMIDDVTLYTESQSDMKINTNFVAGSICYGIPADQVIPVPLLADVKNQSAKEATNVKLTVNAYKNGSDESLFTATQDYGTIKGDSLAENAVFDGMFTVPAEVGGYSFVYTLTSDDDKDSTNNVAVVPFRVTEDTYQKLIPERELGVNYMSSNRYGSDNPFHSYGTAFYVKDASDRYLEHVRFGITPQRGDTAFTSGVLKLDIYSWKDLNENNECDPVGASGVDEKTYIGGATMIINSDLSVSAMGDTILEPLTAEDERITFTDDTEYFALLTYQSFEGSKYINIKYFSPDGRNLLFDHSASEYAYAQKGLYERDGSIGAVFANESDKAKTGIFTVSTSAFGTFFVNVKLGTVTGTEDFNASLGINAYPNPTSSGKLTLDIGLEDVSKKVKVDFMDAAGKLIMSKSYANIQNDQLIFDVSTFANGIYMMNVITDEGVKSQKVTIFNAK